MSAKLALLVVTIVLAASLPAVTHFALAAHARHEAGVERQKALRRLLAMQTRNRELAKTHAVFVAHAEALVERASLVGAVPKAWDRYSVSLERMLQFSELENLLRQTEHGPGYYFSPEFLEIRLPASVADSDVEATVDSAAVDGEGDVALTLRGSFLVRRRGVN